MPDNCYKEIMTTLLSHSAKYRAKSHRDGVTSDDAELYHKFAAQFELAYEHLKKYAELIDDKINNGNGSLFGNKCILKNATYNYDSDTVYIIVGVQDYRYPSGNRYKQVSLLPEQSKTESGILTVNFDDIEQLPNTE